ncbi:MAG TPA: HAD family hydrolase [Bryobacteraceae bacterium]|nr:HAD family hydrolase [Bryobacteraceae bacterium]
MTSNNTAKHFLLISDFDQTLSFHDSGLVLSEMLGLPDFAARAAGLAGIHLVQQGAELSYLLLHDPDFRRVRREHLIEVGKRVRLKENLPALSRLLNGIEGHQFSYHVVSAAPEEVIQSALEGIVDRDHIHGTRFRYNASSGEIESIVRVPAGYGKVAVVEQLRAAHLVAPDRIIYIGDGSSDVHVMLHLNRLGGLTIAVSENPYITEIARRTILGRASFAGDALSVLIPILEEAAGWNGARIRQFFESHGFALREWSKTRTDNVILSPAQEVGV